MTNPSPAIRALIAYTHHKDACPQGQIRQERVIDMSRNYDCTCGLVDAQLAALDVEALLAGLPVPEPTQEWQSIDNPPPTAQTVLLSNGYNVSSGYFADTDRKPRWHDASMTDYGLPATVWMPTPDPPEPAQEQN